MEILFTKIHFYGGFMKKLHKIGPNNLEHFSKEFFFYYLTYNHENKTVLYEKVKFVH